MKIAIKILLFSATFLTLLLNQYSIDHKNLNTLNYTNEISNPTSRSGSREIRDTSTLQDFATNDEINIEIPEIQDTSTFDVTDEERDILIKLVYLEARGENYEGKKAVASIVFNRVESIYWGSDIETIVFAKKQFSPSSKIPNLKIGTDIVWEECTNAVDDVIKNGSILPLYVLYFRSGYHFSNKVPYCVIDNHYFSYTKGDFDKFQNGTLKKVDK